MKNMPIVSKEAINEAFNKFNNIDMTNHKEIKRVLIANRDSFIDKQPEIAEFIYGICNAHDKIQEGVMVTTQFIMYAIIIIASMHIQKEMDDIEKLFNEGDN